MHDKPTTRSPSDVALAALAESLSRQYGDGCPTIPYIMIRFAADGETELNAWPCIGYAVPRVGEMVVIGERGYRVVNVVTSLVDVPAQGTNRAHLQVWLSDLPPYVAPGTVPVGLN